GRPASGAQIRAFPRERHLNLVQILTTTADKDGVFDLPGAVTGSYSVFATGVSSPPSGVQQATGAARPPANTIRGYAVVAIAGASIDLKIVMSPAIAVAGRVTIEGRPPRDNDPELGKVRFSLAPDQEVAGMGSAILPIPEGDTFDVNPNGTFTRRVYTGDYRVRSVWGFAPTSYVKSIRMGSVDMLDDTLRVTGPLQDPLEITIGSDGGELTGVVVGPRSEPISNATVAIVPEAAAQRRRIDSQRSATTDANGRFRLQGIPPGNSKLFAWEFAPFGASEVPEFLQKYEALGKPVLVRPNSKQEIEITAIPARK
ncbi:MAG TPA: carboxypeptidase-like regulatory domain-containing protein, partial [Terriglobia bacterium]|nr:carboxypeptidase-like regulatory domain-containing protein [Terriglobia bacterium]